MTENWSLFFSRETSRHINQIYLENNKTFTKRRNFRVALYLNQYKGATDQKFSKTLLDQT